MTASASRLGAPFRRKTRRGAAGFPFAPFAAFARVVTATAFACGALACDRPPQADSLREWTPADHHSTDDDKLAQGGQKPAPRQAAAAAKTPRARPSARADAAGAAGETAAAGETGAGGATGASEATQLVDLTWRQQCASCHGVTGRGDGQLGPMVRAPDLTREEWQSRVTDAEIAATIKNGKGKMPNFDVPPSVIEGLVARVRATRGR